MNTTDNKEIRDIIISKRNEELSRIWYKHNCPNMFPGLCEVEDGNNRPEDYEACKAEQAPVIAHYRNLIDQIANIR